MTHEDKCAKTVHSDIVFSAPVETLLLGDVVVKKLTAWSKTDQV